MMKYLPKIALVSLVCGFLYTLVIQIPVLGILFLLPFGTLIPSAFRQTGEYISVSFVSLHLTSIEAYAFYGFIGAGVTFVACLFVLLLMQRTKR